jgi:hypothetical protein
MIIGLTLAITCLIIPTYIGGCVIRLFERNFNRASIRLMFELLVDKERTEATRLSARIVRPPSSAIVPTESSTLEFEDLMPKHKNN